MRRGSHGAIHHPLHLTIEHAEVLLAWPNHSLKRKEPFEQPNLYMNAMYRLYCDWCREENGNPASAFVYRKVFNTENWRRCLDVERPMKTDACPETPQGSSTQSIAVWEQTCHWEKHINYEVRGGVRWSF